MIPESPGLASSLLVPLVVAALGLRRKWLTPSGAAGAVAVGAAVMQGGWNAMCIMLTFFGAGSLGTKIAARVVKVRDKVHGDEDARRGRAIGQVLATGALPALLCVLQPPHWRAMYIAYMACNLGDTLASEGGTLAPGKPLLITTLQPVTPGTDGAVSLWGTLFALLGGALVGAVAGCAGAGAVYGAVGSVLDSMLGAVLQPPWAAAHHHASMNSLVNTCSAVLTMLLAVAVHALPLLWLPLTLVAVAQPLLFLLLRQRGAEKVMEPQGTGLGASDTNGEKRGSASESTTISLPTKAGVVLGSLLLVLQAAEDFALVAAHGQELPGWTVDALRPLLVVGILLPAACMGLGEARLREQYVENSG